MAKKTKGEKLKRARETVVKHTNQVRAANKGKDGKMLTSKDIEALLRQRGHRQ